MIKDDHLEELAMKQNNGDSCFNMGIGKRGRCYSSL